MKSESKKTTVKEKLKALFADKRTYRKRLVIAAPICLALCFTILFFGPLEIVAFSGTSLLFSYTDVLPLITFISIPAFLIGTALLALIPGKVFNYIASGIFAFTVGAYLQSLFLNGSLGALTGDAIPWQQNKLSLLIGLFVWFILYVFVYLLLYLKRSFWKKAVVIVSLALVLMQSVPMFGIFFGAYDEVVDSKEKGYFLSTEGMFEYSSEKNIFVFLLDRLDYDYIQEVLTYNPEFFNTLDGFTTYTNAISAYARTRPAAADILNGYSAPAYDITPKEYYSSGWNSDGKDLFGVLKNLNYRIDVYSEVTSMFSDYTFAENHISNFDYGTINFSSTTMLKNLITLSAYRYFPLPLKPFLWSSTDAYNEGVTLTSRGDSKYDIYRLDESAYAEGFSSSTAQIEQNTFKFYHFNGSHPPYYLTSDGTKSQTPTSSLEQTMGSFRILYRLFDRMKELGIYEDATIIITADHGNAVSDYQELTKATCIGLFYKPSGSAGTPLVSSHAPVSVKNIPATIMKEAGGDYLSYGTPLDEIAEDADIVRTYYKTVMAGTPATEAYLYTYEVVGDATVFENWKLIEQRAVIHPYY